jgi:hypothetical protein
METYDQEISVAELFKSIAAGFKRIENLKDASKIQEEVKELTSKMQEAKT